MKTEVVAYCRVSSTGQQKTGTGLDRQEEAIRAYTKQAGYKLTEVYQEAFTGTENDRPVFEKMVADLLDNGCRTIVIECLDRLARDLSVQLQIIALLASKKLTLINAMTGLDVTKPTDAMAKAMCQIQGVFAELDKSLLVRKLKKGREAAKVAYAKKHKTKVGKCEGRKPYGYYEGESEILARIKKLYRKTKGRKRLSPDAIAKVLNTENIPTRSGGIWYGATVRRILSR